jgi:hypothetical protein
VDPVSDPLLLKNLVVPGIEPGSLDLQLGTMTTVHRGGHTESHLSHISPDYTLKRIFSILILSQDVFSFRSGCFLMSILTACGLVVRVPSYRFRGPGSIPGATRFTEK